MQVLVVDAYPLYSLSSADLPGHRIADLVVSLLEHQGNEVEVISVGAPEFAGFMTADEKRSYESDEPLIAAETRASAAAVQRADALLFCYPTTMFGMPPVLKSWLERVMVPGVAFVFDDSHRVRPGLKNVRRLGVVTTSPHGRVAMVRARDLGYRTFMRALRLNCSPLCRRTFVRLPQGAPAGRHADRLQRSLRGWS